MNKNIEKKKETIKLIKKISYKINNKVIVPLLYGGFIDLFETSSDIKKLSISKDHIT